MRFSCGGDVIFFFFFFKCLVFFLAGSTVGVVDRAKMQYILLALREYE
jgi:hypothetical protein